MKPIVSFRRWFISLLVVLFWTAPVSGFWGKPNEQSLANPNADHKSDTVITPKSKRKWSSMFMVDPSKILVTLINKGGLVIPKSVEKDLNVMKQVFHCERAELNVLEKNMILFNFTLGIPQHKTSLRIGRVYLHWDSYYHPSIDIEVDDVDILVEFTNLMLTKNNWNELKAFGFPPTLEEDSPSHTSKTSEGFVRINSVDLSGNITINITSRPMKKDLGLFSVDMDFTDDLFSEIQTRSNANKKMTGRRGVSTTELADIIQVYFTAKIKVFLKDLLEDIAMNPRKAVESADRFLNRASDSIVGYASEAGRKKSEAIESAITSRLEGWGITGDKLDVLRNRVRDAYDKTPTKPAPREKDDPDYEFPDW